MYINICINIVKKNPSLPVKQSIILSLVCKFDNLLLVLFVHVTHYIVTLIPDLSSAPGVLRITEQDTLTTGLYANRRAAYVNDTITLSFTAGHEDDEMNMYSVATAQWLHNGVLARTPPMNAMEAHGRLKSTLSFSFQESDAGIYQCIFMSDNSQVYGTVLLRLETG